MGDNFRHAQYRADGSGIDDPQRTQDFIGVNSSDGPIKIGATVVTFGDSLGARDWARNAGTPTVTGQVGGFLATCNMAAHKLWPGDTFKICNFADPAYNLVGTCLTRIDANNFTYRTDIAISNPAPTGPGEFREPAQLGNNGFFTWANATAGGRATLLSNACNSGENLAQMLARFDRDVLPHNAGFLVFLGGINDVRTGSNNAVTMFALWRQIVERARNAGMTVFGCTLPTFAPASPFLTADRIATIMRFNSMIKAYVRENKGVVLADFQEATANPAATDGSSFADCFEDNDIHQNPKGGQLWGSKLAAAMISVMPPMLSLPGNPADSFTFDTSAILDNPLMQLGAGGFVGAAPIQPASVAPQNWRVEGSGAGASITTTLVARTVAADGDTIGNNVRFVAATLTANNDSMQLRQNGLTARVAAGQYYWAECSMKVVNCPSTLKRLNLTVNFTVDGVAYSSTTGAGTTSNVFLQTDGTYIWRTTPIRIPVNAVSITAAEVVAFFQVSGAPGAGNNEMIIGRAQERQVLANV
jgi:lysophospholipase L1-like esterase